MQFLKTFKIRGTRNITTSSPQYPSKISPFREGIWLPNTGKGSSKLVDQPSSVLLLVAYISQRGLTRVANPDGSPILIQAVAVWDTVGSLGIPTIG